MRADSRLLVATPENSGEETSGRVMRKLALLVAGLLLRAVPSLLVDLGVNGYLAMVFFGAALLHALITAPRGLAGQWLAAFQRRSGKGQP